MLFDDQFEFIKAAADASEKREFADMPERSYKEGRKYSRKLWWGGSLPGSIAGGLAGGAIGAATGNAHLAGGLANLGSSAGGIAGIIAKRKATKDPKEKDRYTRSVLTAGPIGVIGGKFWQKDYQHRGGTTADVTTRKKVKVED